MSVCHPTPSARIRLQTEPLGRGNVKGQLEIKRKWKIESSQVVKDFEEMSSDIGHRTRVLFGNIEIFDGDVPCQGTDARKDERILKISFSAHHAVDSRLLHAPIDVSNTADVSVRKHRHRQALSDLFNDLPISNAGQWTFHLTRSPVHGDNFSSSALQHLCVLNRPFLVLEHTDFASHRNIKMFVKGANYKEKKIENSSGGEEKFANSPISANKSHSSCKNDP